MVIQFRNELETIRNAKGIIIDLRENGGGNSSISAEIVSHFATQPFTGAAWKTPIHDAVYKAWGKYADDYEMLKKYKSYYYDHVYRFTEPTVRQPTEKQKIDTPTVVLIGNRTASAAEDFLIMADDIKHITYVGEPTFGSTGQPLIIEFPGGGGARVSTKRDFYPDGREFIGIGVQRDILVERSVENFLKGFDDSLRAAKNLLIE